jgi:hypothetical protein
MPDLDETAGRPLRTPRARDDEQRRERRQDPDPPCLHHRQSTGACTRLPLP